jgi:excisionase family DNA binding protein
MVEQIHPAMTVREVANFLAVDEKTIYRLAQQGKLPCFKVAGTWRFQLHDIQGWIDEQKKISQLTASTTAILANIDQVKQKAKDNESTSS